MSVHAPMSPIEPAGGEFFEGAVDRILDGRWPRLQGRIVTDPAGREVLPLDRPDFETSVARSVERFRESLSGADARGVASLWTQCYFATAWAPFVAGALVLEEGVDSRAAGTGIVLADDGRPDGLLIDPAARRLPPLASLESLVRAQAPPLLEAAVGGRLSLRVPWSNAANVLGWILDQLRTIAGPDTLAPGYALLERRYHDDGTLNPLFSGAGCACAPGRPARRICCLYYRVDGSTYCADCPIAPAARPEGDPV